MITTGRISTLPAWRPPPFCRTSWSSEAARASWEPRLAAARDAIEDLAIIRAAEEGGVRIFHARAVSRERLYALAARHRVSLDTLPPEQPGRHDVAAGRAARLALVVGGGDRPHAATEPAACEDDVDADPVWRLAMITPGITPDAGRVDEGRDLAVAGNWAANPLLAAIGLSLLRPWSRHFACTDALADGAASLACARRHHRAAAIEDLCAALSWPASWTALHGIAEVKTPLFRFVRDTPWTPVRLVIHRAGTTMPDNAARGLGFPFATRRGGS